MSASPPDKNAGCPGEAAWADLALGQADPGRADALRRHLGACFRCREEFGDLRELLAGMQGVAPAPSSSPDRVTERLVQSWSSRVRSPFRRPGAPGLLLAGFVIAATAVILVLIPDRQEPPARWGAVDTAPYLVEWEPDHRAMRTRLLGLQHADGSWGGSGSGGEAPVVLTALAALAIAAHSDSDAPEAVDALRRAAQWLASQQREGGLIAGSDRHIRLQHGSALIALSDLWKRYSWSGLDPVIRQAREYSLRLDGQGPEVAPSPGTAGAAGSLAVTGPSHRDSPQVPAMLSDLLEARPHLSRELGVVGTTAVRMLARE